ncbi:lytic transglycosylase domain-containing protein [Reinekea sp.]|jgi:soluble lytic murein transglycosylase-like protein|uniref:lytic transglycosylase domain-containing protein n=1 Tax=Reinekea sp. TaxID=1970455 RepID=UPI00398A1531
MRITKFIATLSCAFTLNTALASNLFIYLSPTGERVVTDRPISLAGYELENNKLNANSAGTALRYQDNQKNQDLIETHINNAAYLYGIESSLIKAVIRQESAFNIQAKSRKGAMGLMQLMPGTAAIYKVSDIYDPKQNIYAGTKHLRYLLRKYNDTSLALAAYNAGEGAVKRFEGIPPYPETQNYVVKVMAYYDHYQNGN